jgi:hypothetical protein
MQCGLPAHISVDTRDERTSVGLDVRFSGFKTPS